MRRLIGAHVVGAQLPNRMDERRNDQHKRILESYVPRAFSGLPLNFYAPEGDSA